MVGECTAHERVTYGLRLSVLSLLYQRVLVGPIRMKVWRCRKVWGCVAVEDGDIAREVPVGEVVEEANEIICL